MIKVIVFFVCISLPLFVHSQDKTTTQKYSLIIPGGVSLGVYQAGATWAILEALRSRRKHLGDTLDSITGASAGSINSVLSSIRYCTNDESDNWNVSNNLIREAWDIDIETLMPDAALRTEEPSLMQMPKSKAVSLKEGLFSRQAFNKVAERIEEELSTASFIAGCTIKIGIVVTKERPFKREIPLDPEDIAINVERFVFPLVFGVSEKGVPYFTNNLEIENPLLGGEDRSENYLYARLPADNDLPTEAGLPSTTKVIPLDIILRALYASSAFPFAFEPVEIAYCLEKEIVNKSTAGSNGFCDEGYSLERSDFVDGGFYDNSPIGVAVDLSQGDISLAAYIYVDPSNIPSKYQALLEEKDEKPTPIVEKNLETVANIFLGGLRKQVFNQELLSEFEGSSYRQLLRTRRHVPLTGSYLFNFVAFLDSGFRVYDYTSGVYDGLLNIARYDCRGVSEKDSTCVDDRFVQLSIDLFDSEAVASCLRNSSEVCSVFLELVKKYKNHLYDEIKEDFDPNVDSLSESKKLLFEAVEFDNGKFTDFLYRLYVPVRKHLKAKQDEEGFFSIASLLETQRPGLYSSTVEYMLPRWDYIWYAPLTERALNRIDKLNSESGITKLAAEFLPQTTLLSDSKRYTSFIGLDVYNYALSLGLGGSAFADRYRSVESLDRKTEKDEDCINIIYDNKCRFNKVDLELSAFLPLRDNIRAVPEIGATFMHTWSNLGIKSGNLSSLGFGVQYSAPVSRKDGSGKWRPIIRFGAFSDKVRTQLTFKTSARDSERRVVSAQVGVVFPF